MTFKLEQLESMVAWCAVADELSAQRDLARRVFFAEDDPQAVRYLEGTSTPNSRQRRFLGWFMFSYTLGDGVLPGILAAEELFSGAEKSEAVGAVEGARYMLAIVTSVIPGRSLFLELEDERFDLRSRQLSREFTRDIPLVSWIVPSRPKIWIPGPGWTQWPVGIGPNMRGNLKNVQPDPLAVERLFQGRSDRSEFEDQVGTPRDATLIEAVERMTEAAEANGREDLVMSAHKWERLVLKYLKASDVNSYVQEVANRVGSASDFDELNVWLGLAMNIWNTTPQPDRAGLTAYELSNVSEKE